MSFHFRKGTTYAAYADTGPGKIVVDPLADIQATGASDALGLNAGPWKVTVNGSISSVDGAAIYLAGPGFSNITVGREASAFSSGNGVAVHTSHAANITNAGEIEGFFGGIEVDNAANNNFSINNLNTGLIVASYGALQALGLGTHRITNAGTIISGHDAINGGEGVEVVTNSGRISGYVDLGGGNDIFTNFKKVGHFVKYGKVAGYIDLGPGDDHFNAGKHSEAVADNGGTDIYKLAGGGDLFIAKLNGGSDLVDVVDGGKGHDKYDASDAGAFGVFINLDKIDHFGFAAMTADDIEQDVASAKDIIKNFEDAVGSGGDDVLLGSSVANELFGGYGMDLLTGFGGKDELFGGEDRDFFIFTLLKDSGATKATRDTIHDFEGAGIAGGDLINLDTLNTRLGDIITGFLGVDVAFTGHRGDLRAVTSGDDTIVQLDVNGDSKADFSIALLGHHNLTVGDFTL